MSVATSILGRLSPREPGRARRGVEAARYGLSQAGRVAWFLGHYMIAARLAPAGPVDDAPPPGTFPRTGAILRDLVALLRRDWDNIQRGLYKAPHDMRVPPRDALAASRRFFADLPAVNLRRRERVADEVFTPATRGRMPRYYLQNFHFQTDGYLSDQSASLYDFQVEVLFAGGADAMRRQALPVLGERLGRLAAPVMMDVACGTGRLLSFARDSFPGIRTIGLDLSPAYLAQARRVLAPFGGSTLIAGNAEALPAADASLDAVTCVYLFHELPRKIRATVAAEIARALKPGGLLVLIDSLQKGDEAAYDGLLDRFPQAFHEPYYADYCRQDLSALLTAAGFSVDRSERAFFSKMIVATKRD